MARLALIGGGGFAMEVYEIAQLLGHEVVGYFATEQSEWKLPYLGSPDRISGSAREFDQVALAFGAVDRRSVRHRADFARRLNQIAPISPALVSPRAIVGGEAILEPGAFVGHNVVLGPNCHIAAFSVLNTAVSVGHHATIGFGSIVAPHAFIGGGTTVGELALLGPGTLILQGLTLGDEVVVGIGTSVFRNVPKGSTVWPARMQVAPKPRSKS